MILKASRANRTQSFEELSAASRNLYRIVLAVVPPPAGMPGLKRVLGCMSSAVNEFARVLSEPTESFKEIRDGLNEISLGLAASTSIVSDHSISFRRISGYPAWRLLTHLPDEFTPKHLAATGAELSLAILQRKPFRKEIALLLVSELKGTLGESQHDALQRKLSKSVAEATRLFDTAAVFIETKGPSFEERLRDRVRATLYFGRDRQHQAIADHRASTSSQMVESAHTLRRKIENGNEAALFHLIAAMSNLPADLACDLPLLRSVQHDWDMVLDTEAGQIKVCVDLFSPGRARVETGSTDALLQSGDVAVVPLPMFVASALEELSEDFPTARTFGEMLDVNAKPIIHKLTQGGSGIAATFARFRNGLGPLSVELGIPRYVAAMLLTNPLLVPTGKFFYSRVLQDEIWNAAGTLYESLGWGKPVSVVTSLAAGSRQIASDETISAWGAWIKRELVGSQPGKRYTLSGLVRHHNIMALACASMTIFQLALRARKVIPVTHAMTMHHGLTVSIFDKRVGEFPGGRPVPVCTLQKNVFAAWNRHLEQFADRIFRLGREDCRKLVAALTEYFSPERAAFFEIDHRLRIAPISSARAHSWWPTELKLAPNFGRHCWQNRLRGEGVADSDIDMFVRHSVSGMDSQSSTSHVVMADWARSLICKLDEVNAALGLDAVFNSFRGVNR